MSDDFAAFVENADVAGSTVDQIGLVALPVKAERQSEVRPRSQMLAVGIENLHATVLAVGDIKFAIGSGKNDMGDMELTLGFAFRAPFLKELAIFGEFGDAR